MNNQSTIPFNSPLEVGLRSTTILLSLYPTAIDLQTLVELDYLVVHSADAGGPASLHAPLPYRAGELLVRRGIIEAGLMLFIGRGLLERKFSESGFEFLASDNASPFISSLSSSYIEKLKLRAEWATSEFRKSDGETFKNLTRRAFNQWNSQFQAINNNRDA